VEGEEVELSAPGRLARSGKGLEWERELGERWLEN
jgi:hypothetical protein